MSYQTVKLERRDRVARLSLNRPEALNALNPELALELAQVVHEVKDDSSLKVLVISGEGRAFCAGADLKFIEGALETPDALRHLLQTLTDTFFELEELPMPVVAVVHGFALAGGLELALACDLILAAEDARLGDQHVNFGLIPGAGATLRLPRKLGLQKAMALFLTGRWLTGKEAEAWGLVLKAVPAAALEQELEVLLDQFRGKSREAYGYLKRTVYQGLGMPARQEVQAEFNTFVHYLATSKHPREGIAAFREKRQPLF